MPGITRRRLAAGVASTAAIVAGGGASAQVAEVTRSLPRTYAGTRLNLAWGTGQVNVTMADFSSEFTEATGISLQFTTELRRPPAEDRSSTRPPRPMRTTST